MSAVVKTSDPRFKTLADLNTAGITIAAVQGDAAVDFNRQNFPKAHLMTITTGNLAAPFIDVSARRADVGIEDASQAHRYALTHPEVKDLFGHDPFNVLPIAWTVRQGNLELLTFMNTAIDWLMVNGRFNRIGMQYPDNGRYVEQMKLVPLGAT